MPTPPDVVAARDAATQAIVEVDHPRKLIVAGPGTGKTFAFRRLLEALGEGEADDRLVVTFIRSLRDDLKAELAEFANVQTFHGYCFGLLKRLPRVRGGLSKEFLFCDALPALVKRDWSCIAGGEIPEFLKLMRNLEDADEISFFLSRANYYDAVFYDDSLYRAYQAFASGRALAPSHQLVIVDEYQDFNRLEVTLLEQLASASPIVVAGDDDQAIYGRFREGSPAFIRALARDQRYMRFGLPYCSRCPSAVTNAACDLLEAAQAQGMLSERIAKQYLPFPTDLDRDFPRIAVGRTSVESRGAEYFGRYIAEQVSSIPEEIVEEAAEKNIPTALVIGPRYHLRDIYSTLVDAGLDVEYESEGAGDIAPDRDKALLILKHAPESNLGWRIVSDSDAVSELEAAIRASATGRPFYKELDPEYVKRVLAEAEELEPPEQGPAVAADPDGIAAKVRLVTNQGSKGLSSQFVFIVGLQATNPRRPTEQELCQFLVAITRTRKKCHLLYTTRYAGQQTARSPLIEWIKPTRKLRELYVDREYLRRAGY